MKRILFFAIILSVYSSALAQDARDYTSKYSGLWLGTLNISEEMSMQLAFEISMLDESAFTAKMNVIEQKAFDIPMDTCIIHDDSLNIVFEAAGIFYDGKYDTSTNKISGHYKQGGGVFELNLIHVDELVTEVHRPQTPIRPFPYIEEEVSYENAESSEILAGTLTMPESDKKLPAVILVSGSGRTDRNETPMGHYLLLSDYLTRNGYVVLRYDKRGVGESSGDYGSATTFDFASDALASFQYLKSRPEVDSKKIGIIGHSEGGLIAPMIAAEKKNKVAFIVMMGGIGVPGDELLYMQTEKILRVNGASEEQITQTLDKNKIHYTIAKTGGDDEEIRQNLLAADPDIDEGTIGLMQWPFFQTMLSLNPAPYIEKVKCPVLAITGEKDLQCPPEENLGGIEKALEKGKCKNYTVMTFPGLNHLFQTAKSGSPFEYEQIPEIIAPAVLEQVVDWMNEVNNN